MTDKQKISSGPLSQKARKILKSLYGLDSERVVNEPNNQFPTASYSVDNCPDLNQQSRADGEKDSLKHFWSRYLGQEKREPILDSFGGSLLEEGAVGSMPAESKFKNKNQNQKIRHLETRYFNGKILIKLLNAIGFNNHKIFSKSRYIRESKGSYVFQLMVAIGIFMLCFFLAFLSDFALLKSEVTSIKSRVGNIQDIVDKTNGINSLLEVENGRLATKERAYIELRNQIYDQNSIKDLVAKFFTILENNRITVKISIARFSNLPVYETKSLDRPVASPKEIPAGGDRAKEVARIVFNKEPITNQVAQGAKNKTEKSTAQNTADPYGGQLLPQDSDLTIPFDKNKKGINYYYIKLELNGSYLNYLAARQQLINLVPGAIVESEKVSTQNNKSTVTIVVGINLPFYQ
jgi:hypothetical protein